MEKHFSAREVGEILGITKQTVINEIYRGELVAMKIASIYRISESDLKDYMERKKTKNGN